MNKELQELIQVSANSYFWLFIVFWLVNFLMAQTKEWEEIYQINKKLGKVVPLSNGTFISVFLFLLSIHYK